MGERGTRRRRIAVSAAVALAASSVAAAAFAAEAVDSEVAFTVHDPAIVESSGLTWVDLGSRRWVVTVNDSGDAGQVFTLDPETGRTAGVTSFAPDPFDVEALAPAGGRHVWVGDIGDNGRVRGTLTLTRVPVGPGRRETANPLSRQVRYPDRARDAEALLAHPHTGRLYVVTKSVLGGQVWQVPELDAPGGSMTMREVGQVPALVTDGAFLPSGDHVLLRTYTHGHLLTYPEWEVVESFVLPPQPQGEGLTVLPDGDVLLSTEGERRDVLRIALPEGVRPDSGPADEWWWGVWSRWVARLAS